MWVHLHVYVPSCKQLFIGYGMNKEHPFAKNGVIVYADISSDQYLFQNYVLSEVN